MGLVDGQKWKERRTFTVSHLKHFGLGKSSFEDIIVNEIEVLLNKLKTDNNRAIEVESYFFFSFVHIIWSFVGGKCKPNYEQLMKLVSSNIFEYCCGCYCYCRQEIWRVMTKTQYEFASIVNTLFSSLSSNPFMFLPFLRHVFRKQFSTFCATVEELDKFLATIIDQHMKSYQEGNIRDFVDAGLAQILSQKNSCQENVLPFTSKLLNISIITFRF